MRERVTNRCRQSTALEQTRGASARVERTVARGTALVQQSAADAARGRRVVREHDRHTASPNSSHGTQRGRTRERVQVQYVRANVIDDRLERARGALIAFAVQ